MDKTTAQPEWRNAAVRPILLIRRKKNVVGRVALEAFSVTLGRAPECDIVLDGCDGVSRTHAQILVLDGEVVIEDLNSRNGVLVNRKPIKRHTMRAGDRIAIGEYRLQVLYEQGDRLDRPENEQQNGELMRLWAGAAITGPVDNCPLCRATVSEGMAQSQQPLHDRNSPPPAPATTAIRRGVRHKLHRRLVRRRGLLRRRP